MFFIKEVECKIKSKNLTYNEKSDDFFSMYTLVKLFGDVNIMIDEHFLSNEEIIILIENYIYLISLD